MPDPRPTLRTTIKRRLHAAQIAMVADPSVRWITTGDGSNEVHIPATVAIREINLARADIIAAVAEASTIMSYPSPGESPVFDMVRGEIEAEALRGARERLAALPTTMTLHTCWDDHEAVGEPGGPHADGSPCLDDPTELVARAAAIAALDGPSTVEHDTAAEDKP